MYSGLFPLSKINIQCLQSCQEISGMEIIRLTQCAPKQLRNQCMYMTWSKNKTLSVSKVSGISP